MNQSNNQPTLDHSHTNPELNKKAKITKIGIVENGHPKYWVMEGGDYAGLTITSDGVAQYGGYTVAELKKISNQPVSQNPDSDTPQQSCIADDTRHTDLREQINEIKDRLAGRNQIHQKVAKLSGWSNSELEQVIKEDNWIYEDEMLALITQQVTAAIRQYIQPHLDYCKTINGRDYCKNCGLRDPEDEL